MSNASPQTTQARPRHVFTVDVEEWFHVLALAPYITRQQWSTLPSRVVASTTRLLELLAQYNSTGTFFVLGWVAERHPGLVRRIADEGHEVASHGWWHQRVTTLTRKEFRSDVRRSRDILSGITGRPVLGFRAPNFSIVPGYEWAFDVLLDEGYGYDSSIFPIRRSSSYGYPGAPDQPYVVERAGGVLYELPLTPLRLAGARIPACGGAYFRHLPYELARQSLRQRERQTNAGVFYIHPWELDVKQPRVMAPMLTRLRQYGGIQRTEARLQRLLSEFAFTTAACSLGLQVENASSVSAGGS